MARRRNAALPLVLSRTDSNEKDGDEMSNLQVPGSLLTQKSCGFDEADHAAVERYKLVVIGDEECGKTALLNTLVKNSDYEVEDTLRMFEECVTDIKTPQEHVEFTLYEITGMDNYSSLRLELYRGADVFLVCFDIGRPETIKNVVNKWAPEIIDEYPEVPFLVVGCKNDLRTDGALLGNQECENIESVSRTKAETVARTVGSGGYVECCAKTRWNIDRVFKAAAEAILTKDEQREDTNVTKQHSVLRRFSRLATNEKQSNSGLKRASIFSFVVGSNS